MPQCALVTGASRGLGLEFCVQLAAAGWRVIAATRSGKLPDALCNTPDVEPVVLDVTSPESITALGLSFENRGLELDLLVNNAGVALDRDANLGAVDYEAWMATLQTNVLGSHRVTAMALPSLARTSGGAFKIANVSSRLGSISQALGPTAFDLASTDVSYRSSKAALNMATACIAIELRKTHPQAAVCALDPAWVNTDMGSKGGKVKPPLEPPEVVAGMLRAINALKPEQSGSFISFEGKVVPW
eukprot:gnl/TRDRNA2_/TRDRNA2_133978_c0_seq1.p1 gnl/TRDRNA2_/TRDRNA2_133978_c0~~gnl/TRDRNA2_/TRDRNA2_133978_c0_seq1.p1  ORF type:complete len:245 (-),score=50.64 gnl/TRDRNA2_/TRDRNA2_133978_c0_seq1:112-846(-)